QDVAARQVAWLQQANQSLREQTVRMSAEIARVSAMNVELAEKGAAAKQSHSKSGSTLGFGTRKWEQQAEIMNSLRQVAAARDQALADGKAPTSVRDLVGATGYIRTIRPVANEDYSELSMEKGHPLTVTTADG